MEYLIFLGVSIFIVGILVLSEAREARKKEKRFVASLYQNYGTVPNREYSPERYVKIDSYWRAHQNKGMDDITWNDCGMDSVFKRMNTTLSATGEEYLYYTLRNTDRKQEELQHQENVVRFFEENPDIRVKMQYLMSRLGYTKHYSLYDYLHYLDNLGERSNKRHIICNLLFIPLIILAPFELSIALLGIAILLSVNIISYFKEKGEIEPYIISFAYIVRLVNTCKEITKVNVPVCKAEWEELTRAVKELEGLNRNSSFVFSEKGGNASGNPLEALMDYGRMIFHLDLIQFNKMLSLVRGRMKEIDSLITTAGYLETCIAIGSFRKSLSNGYCVPEFIENQDAGIGILLKEGYHPLLEKPVKNSMETRNGVLITGSNASGKSTFLKTVALNAILAQTIHTCTADGYRAPIFRIYSSMSLRDDLEGGESYYMVEIRAIKRILDALGVNPVLCFVDEVLRGTNTVERIAASTQILKSLTDANTLCFAATHDIELTDLLKDAYDNYHFEEEVNHGDVTFSYKILTGKATTRNAIKLLEIMGYQEEIVKEAANRAEHFMKTGEWR